MRIFRVLLFGLLAWPALAADRVSGFDQMSPALQAMQTDPAANPGMLWVLEGEGLWNTPAGPAGKACADCHQTMAGVAARYPAWDRATGAPIDLTGRVNRCRGDHQGQTPLGPDAREMLALTAFIARQSDGTPIAGTAGNARLDPALRQGAAFFALRQGQLNLSCAQCHDDQSGQKLGGAVIPQGHPTGYPVYRLEWQGLGSLSRRLRACLAGMRAEPLAPGSAEAVALELYLMERARGLRFDGPAVRP